MPSFRAPHSNMPQNPIRAVKAPTLCFNITYVSGIAAYFRQFGGHRFVRGRGRVLGVWGLGFRLGISAISSLQVSSYFVLTALLLHGGFSGHRHHRI